MQNSTFREFSIKDGPSTTTVAVKLDAVIGLKRTGKGTRLTLHTGAEINVTERYEELAALLGFTPGEAPQKAAQVAPAPAPVAVPISEAPVEAPNKKNR